MTRRALVHKWSFYALALLVVWVLDAYVLPRYPVFGLSPMLLPLAAIAVAVLEGTVAGAGFGLGVGILCDAVYFNPDGAMTVGLCLLGVGAGALSQYVVRQNLVGCLLCSLLALVCIDGVRVLANLLTGAAALPVLLSLAGREIAWSMVFVLPVYALFLWVFRRVPKKTVL